MAGFSDDRRNETSHKRRRTPASTNKSSGDTEGKNKRTATLMDLDVLDCSICFDTLTVPIFQCDNGHVACSTCCKKLKSKCGTCSLPTKSRNRAMERVLELLKVPCENAEFGCSESVSYAEMSRHLERCVFSQRPCPFSGCGCGFTGSYEDLVEHSVSKHDDTLYEFECGESVFIYPKVGERVVLKEKNTGEGGGVGRVLVVVECFETPQGRIFSASCVGPMFPGFMRLSYSFTLRSSSGDGLCFESSAKSVREVSGEPPSEHFMFVPSYMCPDYKLRICITWTNPFRSRRTTTS
ncbi:unnamed protein product [Microthlaspi erraticum]|uniref:RING-type E3 ubiquitin transferase n=1 Tax=Microthlaspi erraticum TaxID=1685480 RepID=A0A6D2L7K2_9BRAS|nr:unnamed protein product [Microthlaspi erraticum]